MTTSSTLLVSRGLSSESAAQPSNVGISARSLSVLRTPGARLIVRRLLSAVPVLFGVTLLTFFIVNLMPGNAAQHLLGAEATAEQVAQLEAQLHLDRPVWERYTRWLGDTLVGDLGKSLSGQQVGDLVAERLPVTLGLVGYAFVLALGFAVPVALLAAHGPNRFVDRLSMVLSMIGLSVANYVLALLLVLVFAVNLAILPAIGFVPLSESVSGNIRSLTLPALAIAFPLFGFYTRFLRGDLLEQMYREDYVVTASAKGLSPWKVLVRHAFRNSLFGLLTLVGLNFGTIVGGTVVIEQIFALPGIGQLLLQAINTRDVVMVQAVVLLLAVITVLANLLVDLLYAVLDPRIRYDHH